MVGRSIVLVAALASMGCAGYSFDTLKKGTKLVGGNVLIVGGYGGYDFVKAGKDPNGMKESGKGSIAGIGYALRAKK